MRLWTQDAILFLCAFLPRVLWCSFPRDQYSSRPWAPLPLASSLQVPVPPSFGRLRGDFGQPRSIQLHVRHTAGSPHSLSSIVRHMRVHVLQYPPETLSCAHIHYCAKCTQTRRAGVVSLRDAKSTHTLLCQMHAQWCLYVIPKAREQGNLGDLVRACSIGRIPSNVIMTRNAIPEMDKLRIISRLETAGTVPRWRAALYEGGHNPNDYLLTSGYVLLPPSTPGMASVRTSEIPVCLGQERMRMSEPFLSFTGPASTRPLLFAVDALYEQGAGAGAGGQAYTGVPGGSRGGRSKSPVFQFQRGGCGGAWKCSITR